MKDKSIAELDKIIKEQPGNAEAYYWRGNAYARGGAYNKAVADFSKVQELDPDNTLTYVWRAAAYGAKAKYDLSLADINRAIKVIPDEQKKPLFDNDVISVIKSTRKIESNSTQRRLYVAAAKRNDLNEQGQVALINAVFDTLLSETAMEDVIITMIQNPNFSDAGKEAIINRVDYYVSDVRNKRIRSALRPYSTVSNITKKLKFYRF